jgi:5-methylcytosine-specific restriction endonuclease McrA
MKLPNFFKSPELNRLKAQMGIPESVYGSLDFDVGPGRLTELELSRLFSPAGLEVTIDDVQFLDDGTLAYKNTRVLLYIRDVSDQGRGISMPRFHVSRCSTLEQMISNKRFNRYVIQANPNRQFDMKIIRSKKVEEQRAELDVCQNCLTLLQFNGFRSDLPSQIRRRHVAAFNLEDFFAQFPRSLHERLPDFNSDNAPLDDYTRDFPDLSVRTKAAHGWICSKCRVCLGTPHLRRFLHVHHINGRKSENNRDNLRVLCIACHAEEPFALPS